jgi:hypothetical protein
VVKVAPTGPGVDQRRLLALCAVLIVLAMLFSSYVQGRKIDKHSAVCARYGAVYDGSGCVKPTAAF